MSSGTAAQPGVVVDIGNLPILLRSDDAQLREMLQRRYRGFLASDRMPQFQLQIELHEGQQEPDADADVEVRRSGDGWALRRGDFAATWVNRSGCGRVLQSRNPYAIDSVLRILHSLLLASRGGFLLHAASAIRNGRAFLFAGVSGAGKTTISRLAPPDVILLTDEVSYIRREPGGYRACGTPFAGELATSGENVSAPIAAVYLLEKGEQNRIEPVEPSEALRTVLRNILFFAEDQELVNSVFQSACDFVSALPLHRLTFLPEERVWELII